MKDLLQVVIGERFFVSLRMTTTGERTSVCMRMYPFFVSLFQLYLLQDEVCPFFGCGFRNDGEGVAAGLIREVHGVISFDGFPVSLLAFGVGVVYFCPRGEYEYLGVVAVMGGGLLKFGAANLLGDMDVSDDIGDTPVKEGEFLSWYIFLESVDGMEKH